MDLPDHAQVDALASWVAHGGVVVLSGAGLSTESGIPDYRGASGTLRRHPPMTYQAFTGDPRARQRYWARSHIGWRTIADAPPNAGHCAVARLQQHTVVVGIITQNVDGLHQLAGAEQVVELHGNLAEVGCLNCGERTTRVELHQRLDAANPGFAASARHVNPDGDVDLRNIDVERFQVVNCRRCAGILKPNVVFFGETVPVDRVRRSFELVDKARTLLVLGSSLAVLSGRRFVLRAARNGVRVAIVNRGVTRGDPYAGLRIDAPLGVILPELARRVDAGSVTTSGWPEP